MKGSEEQSNSNQEGSFDQHGANNHKQKKKKNNYNNKHYYGNNNNYYSNYNQKSYGNYYNYNYGYNKYDKYDYYQGNYSYKDKPKKNIEYYLNKIDQTKIVIPELTQNLITDLEKNKLSCLICELSIKKDQSSHT